MATPEQEQEREKRFQKEWFEHKLAGEKAKAEVLHAIRSRRVDFVLLDARDRASYGKGHLPGARSLPLDEVDALAAELDPQREHVVYCWHAT